MGQIEELIWRIEAAWNAGDVAAYGACYSADAAYVSRAGSLWVGRDEIERQHRTAFEGSLRGTRLKIGLRRVAAIGEGITLVHADIELAGNETAWAMTTFVVQHGLIAAAHTTEI